KRVLALIGYPSAFDAADHVPEILKFKPIGLEGLDDLLIEAEKAKKLNPEGIALLPDGGGWLFVEFGGETVDEAREAAQRMIDAIRGEVRSTKLIDDTKQQKMVWGV